MAGYAVPDIVRARITDCSPPRKSDLRKYRISGLVSTRTILMALRPRTKRYLEAQVDTQYASVDALNIVFEILLQPEKPL